MTNPDLLVSYPQLLLANDHDILVAIYQLLFAAISLAFALVFFCAVFKFLVWFLPNYWYRSKE